MDNGNILIRRGKLSPLEALVEHHQAGVNPTLYIWLRERCMQSKLV